MEVSAIQEWETVEVGAEVSTLLVSVPTLFQEVVVSPLSPVSLVVPVAVAPVIPTTRLLAWVPQPLFFVNDEQGILQDFLQLKRKKLEIFFSSIAKNLVKRGCSCS